MAEPPARKTPGSSLPTTPKRPRGGHLEELLQKFGSQSSATSATKARRISSFTTNLRQPSAESKRTHREESISDPTVLNLSHTSIITTTSSSFNDARGGSSERADTSNYSLSEDELARPVRAVRVPYSEYGLGELKMENRKKEREAPRRSARNRTSDILGSDTALQMPPPQPSTRRKTRPPKLDTARARLRDEIAQKTKAKANNFLVANKHCFLPLLPEHNHISRLVKNGQSDSTTSYERLQNQPKGVTAIMKPYQLDGLSFLVYLHNNGVSGILGDEMGLGKTLQTLSLFQYLEEQDRDFGVESEESRPYLVVCPLSVLSSWVSEARRWVPGLKVLAFHGSADERDRLRKRALGMEDQYGNETLRSRDRKASKKAGLKVTKMPTEAGSDSYKIIVTTYETFLAEHQWFKHSFVWRYVVLDEGHKIKSSVTQISIALRTIASEFRLILTGTPLQNNLLEMWALLAWLYPDVFTENTQILFKESFDLNRGQVNRDTLNNARRLLELIMLRRMKDDAGVDLGLPPKEEVLLYVPLTPMQRFWYTRLLTRVDDNMLNDLFADGKRKELAALGEDKQEADMLARLEKTKRTHDQEKQDEWEETAEIMRQTIKKEQSANDTKVTSAWRRLMNLVMQLRKCCSHPYLLPGTVPEPYYVGQHVIRSSGKFILLEKLLRNSIFNQGKKVLIFSGFTQTLDYCEDMLSILGNFGQDFKSLRLDGGTSRARRKLDMRLFNDRHSEYKVMLLSTRAGGLGINLTSAEDVVFLDEDWNPQVTLQAEARAHRIGQTKKVTIYKLCTQGTVEEQMIGRIRKKLYLSTKITESMKSVHGETVVNTNGRPSLADEMPEMNTNQLKNLVRRGAQTLSHPEIDVTEMLSWDLDTMMQKCRDKPADPHVNPDAASVEVDEEKWLSVMERVECAVFDGKRYQRKLDKETSSSNILPDSITREDRRRGKNTTVMIDGYAINKESLNCADWEAVPTFAGKDPRLAEPQRDKRREFNHEGHCVACFDGPDAGHLVECKSCPRAYHFDCLDPQYQVKVKGFSGFFCPQHNCSECGRRTNACGGLLYRCRWCPRAFCDDCLDGNEWLVGFNLPEFEILREAPMAGGFYINCSGCIEAVREDEERRIWMDRMEDGYRKQHADFIKRQEEEQQRLEEEQDAFQDAVQEALLHQRSRPTLIAEDDAGASPPALTETSVVANGESGVSTPRSQGAFRMQGKKRHELEGNEQFDEGHWKKKARPSWRSRSIEEEDPLLLD
jgi:SWI/SNF-related matrix-associated actin-dependent regulator of chromatin subfamily A member 5